MASNPNKQAPVLLPWEEIEASVLIHNSFGFNSSSLGYSRTTCGRVVPNERTLAGRPPPMTCPECIEEFKSRWGATPYMKEMEYLWKDLGKQ